MIRYLYLRIDDDISVENNGRAYGFKVFLVGSQDDEWDDKIKSEIERIRKWKEKIL